MGKYYWHASIKGRKTAVVRHYRHVKKLYQFILKNPSMFKGRILTIYDHNQVMADLSFVEIGKRLELNLLEGDERRFIRSNIGLANSERLEKAGLKYKFLEEQKKFIVRHGNETADYYAATGDWRLRKSNAKGSGVEGLIAELTTRRKL